MQLLFGGTMLDSMLNEMRLDWKPIDYMDEDEKNFYVELKAPGYKKDEISITHKDGLIRVKGETNRKGKHGSFSHAFATPKKIKPGEIQAQLEDGILTITLPKQEESAVRQIPIQ